MSECVFVRSNKKIISLINNPNSRPGEMSVEEIINAPVQSWLDENCIGEVIKIVAPNFISKSHYGDIAVYRWDELLYLEFEKSEEATAFRMVWL